MLGMFGTFGMLAMFGTFGMLGMFGTFGMLGTFGTFGALLVALVLDDALQEAINTRAKRNGIDFSLPCSFILYYFFSSLQYLGSHKTRKDNG